MKKLINAAVATGATLLVTATPVMAQVQNITINEPSGGVKNFGTLLSAGLQVAIILSAILTFAYLVWGGVQWITSGGDKSAYEAARGRITAALIGLAIVAAAAALMKLIGFFFGVDVFSFQIPSAAQ
ncbi:hypothetical protein A2160_00720 [Candidatus Beckwithbacteria bacterium RBG_13_42_9]|uniref:Uncharacterized protein n=1 Tax=Candidatus Beckwithbacteria bacterium RBG_13_42_9 TaxID=1797457 RepID=A0A1F5E4G2_9BACT|nr:MAG: hypothetical protein A2160_00720 [Candidatus Beckwithbacteria bacterium RBG_13_42_9]